MAQGGTRRRRGSEQGSGAAKQASPARRLALAVLGQVRRRGAHVRDVLDGMLPASGLSGAEAGFASVLCYGVVACEGTLDEALDAHLARPGGIPPQVRDALRISCYELLFLGKPAPVAVDQGVSLVRGAKPRLAGLANAVLRRVADDARRFPFGDLAIDDGALARSEGFPLWMTSLLIRALGRERAASLMSVANGQAPVYLAENPFCADEGEIRDGLAREGVEATAVGPSGCLRAGEPVRAVRSGLLARGAVVVADAAAQQVAALAAPGPGETLLEVGAGRGTKTLLMQAAALRSWRVPGQVFSVDSHAYKVRVLRQRMNALRVPKVTGFVGDATDLRAVSGLPATFDRALVDAPCSGLGTLRRHPELRWTLSEGDIDNLAALQLALAREAARRVRPGGTLVYSTCTVTPDEDEGVVEALLAGEGACRLAIDPIRPDELAREFADDLTPEGFLRTHTCAGGPDAHFCARLRRL